MESTQELALAALLRETEAAHGAYETGVLGGVFDKDWATWYATYLLENGLAERLPRAGSLDILTLTALLTRLASQYEREETHGPWPDFYAQGIVAEVHLRP
jgi:hypothetical protein